jgi:hypothetical protein
MADSNIVASSGKDGVVGEKEHGTETNKGLVEVELQSSGTSADNAAAHEAAVDSFSYCGWVRIALEFWCYGRDEEHVEEGKSSHLYSALKSDIDHHECRNCISTTRSSRFLKLARTS